MYLHTPALEVGSWWRVDTASGSDTATTVYAHDGTDAIPTALGTSGSTVRGNTRDGTAVFWSATATLYCKELTYQGVPTGTVVTSTGGTPAGPGTTAPVDIATISVAVAALPTTYVKLLVTDATSTTLTGTLAAGHLSPVDCAVGPGVRTLPAANSVAVGTPTVAKKADTTTNTLTVQRAGSDLIFGTGSGATSKTLTLSGEAVTFVSNGVDRWSVESSDTPSAAIAAGYAPIAAIPVASSATSGTLTAGAEHNLTPSSAATWTLPTGVSATKLPTTVKNNGTVTVSVARGGSDTINGGTTSVSIAATEWARFTSDGAGAWTQSGTAGQSGTYARPSTLFPGRKVAYAGDSLTVGTGASNASYNFATQVERIAGSARARMAYNGGNAGDKSADLLARMPTILAQGADHVHIQIGTNDAGNAVALSTYQTNIAAIVSLCRVAGVTVSIGLIPPRGTGVSSAVDTATRTLNLWLRLWTARQGIPLADTFTTLADPTTGLLTAGNDSGDHIHPTDAGHLLMARAIAPVLPSMQVAPPWPVTAVSPIGMLSNPVMNGTTGWSDQGGTAASATLGTAAPTAGDGLPAGNWLTWRINNSANGSTAYRQVAATLNASLYTAGDTIAVFAYMAHSDATLASAAKLQFTNNSVAWSIPLDTTSSVNNPGPLIATTTIPGSPATLRLAVVLTAGANIDVTAYLGAVQVYNLTTGGLVASV